MIPLITTTTQVQDDRANISANKKKATEQGKAPELLRLSGVNIAFSQFGLTKVRVLLTVNPEELSPLHHCLVGNYRQHG